MRLILAKEVDPDEPTLPPVEGLPPLPEILRAEEEDPVVDAMVTGYDIWKKGGDKALLAEIRRRADAKEAVRSSASNPK